MKIHTRTLSILFLIVFIFYIPALHAQSTIPASGGDASGPGGTVSFTAGQVVYSVNTSASGSVFQGVQQPYEISVVTGVNETEIEIISFVYPNPTNSNLTLKVENHDITGLSYILADSKGTVLENIKLFSDETLIPMTDRSPGLYFLKIIDKKLVIVTFKIIKY